MLAWVLCLVIALLAFQANIKITQDKNWKKCHHQLLRNERENAKLCTEPYSQ